MHDELDAFIAEVLSDPEAKAAYDDATAQHAVIDGLLARRRELGWSQARVAQEMGCDYRTVARFEYEWSNPRIQTAQRYARAVGLRIVLKLEADDAESK